MQTSERKESDSGYTQICQELFYRVFNHFNELNGSWVNSTLFHIFHLGLPLMRMDDIANCSIEKVEWLASICKQKIFVIHLK